MSRNFFCSIGGGLKNLARPAWPETETATRSSLISLRSLSCSRASAINASGSHPVGLEFLGIQCSRLVLRRLHRPVSHNASLWRTLPDINSPNSGFVFVAIRTLSKLQTKQSANQLFGIYSDLYVYLTSLYQPRILPAARSTLITVSTRNRDESGVSLIRILHLLQSSCPSQLGVIT